ncbi:SH3 domain-containing protein [Roseomonas sp. BN140053]|uniref:SH3 domain-containing protein n=1 Tax=Roseomonas sp. BN140053 TaxID=3391898 RepID=UPI0039ECE2CF
MRFGAVILAGVAAAVLQAFPARAAPGYVSDRIPLRAGPGTQYPRLAVLRAGEAVEILGCLDGWNWCDIGVAGQRGWVSGSLLRQDYRGRRVPLPQSGSLAGVPVVTFRFSDYWGEHYRDRPWFAERDRWSGPRSRARGSDRDGSGRGGPDHGGPDRGGPDRGDAGRGGSDRADPNRGDPGRGGPDRNGSARPGPAADPGDRGGLGR